MLQLVYSTSWLSEKYAGYPERMFRWAIEKARIYFQTIYIAI
jgi:hypothetical protein